MRVSDVREIVQSARVDAQLYSFESERHEALCLLAFGETWKVFLSERGERPSTASPPRTMRACTS